MRRIWQYDHTQMTTASREDVWAIYSDVPGWHDWDPAVRRISLEGPFAAGTRGKVRPSLGPTVSFELTDVRPLHGFEYQVRLPLAVLHFGHALTDAADGGLAISHPTRVTGPLAPLWGRVIGNVLAWHTPIAQRGLAFLAERRAAA